MVLSTWKASAPLGQRDLRQRDAHLPLAFGSDDVVIVDEHDTPPQGPMRRNDWMVRRWAKVGDLPGTEIGHGDTVGIRRVEHGRAMIGHVLHDDALENREVFDRGDVVETEVVARADVGDDGDLTTIERQSLTQNAATRGLQYGRVHVRMGQHAAGALGAAAIAAVDLSAVDIDAVDVGKAHSPTAPSSRGSTWRCGRAR